MLTWNRSSSFRPASSAILSAAFSISETLSIVELNSKLRRAGRGAFTGLFLPFTMDRLGSGTISHAALLEVLRLIWIDVKHGTHAARKQSYRRYTFNENEFLNADTL